MIYIDPADFKSDKILSLKESAIKIARLRKLNKKVGLCHGGFDLLHAGHIKHFESAANLCDSLFVSITSDRYVTLRKGNGRPIFQDILRAYSIASIKYVDYVLISDFNLGVEVIKILRPNYYIKGPDYIGKTDSEIMAEKKIIESHGGKIIYTEDQKLSTSDIIRYIRDFFRIV